MSVILSLLLAIALNVRIGPKVSFAPSTIVVDVRSDYNEAHDVCVEWTREPEAGHYYQRSCEQARKHNQFVFKRLPYGDYTFVIEVERNGRSVRKTQPEEIKIIQSLPEGL